MGRVLLSGLLIMMLLIIPLRMISQVRDNNGVIAPGNITGYITNYYGLAISGATVGVQGGPVTTSGPDGSYLLEGVDSGGKESKLVRWL